MTTNNNQTIIFIGSFLAQTVQVGIFSLFLAQKLNVMGVPLSIIGWFIGIQWATVLVLAPFVPRLGNYISLNKQNLLSGFITFSGLCFAFGSHLLSLAAAAILVGAGLVMRWVACDALVVQLSEDSTVGRSIGIHEALMGFGIAVGPLFFTSLELEHVLYATVLVIAFSTAVFMFVRENQLNHEDQQHISLKPKDFLFIKIALVAALVGGLIEMAAVSLFPFYFSVDGFSLYESALFISAFGLGGTLLQLPLGFLADKVGYRQAQCMVCIIALFGIVGLYFSPPVFASMYAILFLFGGAIGAFNTLAVIQAGSELDIRKMASGMAYIAAFYTFGGIVGPIITASILQEFHTDAILVTYGCLIALIIVVVIGDLFEARQQL